MSESDSPERTVMQRPLYSVPLPLAMRQGRGCTEVDHAPRAIAIAWVLVALLAGVVFAAAVGG